MVLRLCRLWKCLNNDIQAMNDIVVRLEELYALSTNGFNTDTDKAALEAEASTLLTEISRIATDAKWKGNTLADGTGKTVGFGRNGGDLAIEVAAFAIPDVTDSNQPPSLEHFKLLILREQQRQVTMVQLHQLDYTVLDRSY